MLRYQSRRHRFLMDESERALEAAAHGKRQRDARIASDIIGDNRIYRLWESRHADLVLPVAEQRQRDAQIFRLRDVEVKLLHRRSLIRTIRGKGIVGNERTKLFAAFYGPRDTQDAILAEHRQYTLAVSSRVSADHLIHVMRDPVSKTLLGEYETIYSKYFDLYCQAVSCDDPIVVDALRPEMSHMRRRALMMIKRIHSERPLGNRSSLEHQALLARSGRFVARDYLVR